MKKYELKLDRDKKSRIILSLTLQVGWCHVSLNYPSNIANRTARVQSILHLNVLP